MEMEWDRWKKMEMQTHLLLDMAVFTFLFFAGPPVFIELWSAGRMKAAAVAFFFFFLLMDNFYKKIYLPVKTIEKVVHGMAQGDSKLCPAKLRETDGLYPLYKDLDTLMCTLKELAAKEANARFMRKQAELDALQSQINPHFLYNTLESIRGQAMVHGMHDIEEMTQALSNLFRYSISSQGDMATLDRELKNIDHYLMIQQYRFHNKFLYKNHVDEDTLGLQIPKLLLQPIVENAIHHGLETKEGQGRIEVRAYRTKKRLLIQVRDDGIGIPKDKLAAVNDVLENGKRADGLNKAEVSIGLINVNERIKLNYGQEYGLHVYSAQDVGTNVEFVLPCR